jgi:hypothetical protein
LKKNACSGLATVSMENNKIYGEEETIEPVVNEETEQDLDEADFEEADFEEIGEEDTESNDVEQDEEDEEDGA